MISGKTTLIAHIGYPTETFKGTISQIRLAPQTVQNVVTYTAVVNVDNPDLKLKPGMTASISIITAQRSGVLKVPHASLRFKPPEPSTNRTFVARLLGKIGLGTETKSARLTAITDVIIGFIVCKLYRCSRRGWM